MPVISVEIKDHTSGRRRLSMVGYDPVLMNRLAQTPKPPYYAVVFTSQLTDHDHNGYTEMSDRMFALAAQQPGYLGVEAVHGEDGFGMTVSYWESLDAIRNWRAQAEHKIAQAQGRAKWYQRYQLRICRVEKDYSFVRDGN
ncbi:MAG: antibiotic biosynthesis monooxygenase [Phycisphaerales bacterium]